MLSLFSSGSKYQKLARQHNCNLVEGNGCWLLYCDGLLVARDRYPQDVMQFIRTPTAHLKHETRR